MCVRLLSDFVFRVGVVCVRLLSDFVFGGGGGEVMCVNLLSYFVSVCMWFLIVT